MLTTCMFIIVLTLSKTSCPGNDLLLLDLIIIIIFIILLIFFYLCYFLHFFTYIFLLHKMFMATYCYLYNMYAPLPHFGAAPSSRCPLRCVGPQRPPLGRYWYVLYCCRTFFCSIINSFRSAYDERHFMVHFFTPWVTLLKF